MKRSWTAFRHIGYGLFAVAAAVIAVPSGSPASALPAAPITACPSPTGISPKASGITSSGFTVSYTGIDSPACGYRVGTPTLTVRENTATVFVPDVVVTGTPGQVAGTLTVTGLKPGTLYVWMVTDTGGTGVWTGAGTVTTLGATTPTATPSTIPPTTDPPTTPPFTPCPLPMPPAPTAGSFTDDGFTVTYHGLNSAVCRIAVGVPTLTVRSGGSTVAVVTAPAGQASGSIVVTGLSPGSYTWTLTDEGGNGVRGGSGTVIVRGGPVVTGSASPSTPPPAPACTATYKLLSEWGGGFAAQVTVRAGDTAINGWTVRWPIGAAGVWPWGATVTVGPDGTATAVNQSWNGRVGAGQTVTFGFSTNGGSPSPAAVTCSA